ncbi:hypothetical protein ML462_11425 [Gramella lutea]|uniref:Uncharacterized protein n=1 Tax=Christiangramia lutea TaxID=1607951 RepID=A0A9X2AB18_9FLAO|nr:hypothetical protein [Christiangramia lutea]MCH4823781.1 hypothetical protein [Christiangramia lutea]
MFTFLIVIIPFSLVENIGNFYEDESIFKLEKTTEVKELAHIRTNPIRAKLIDQVIDEVVALRKEEVKVNFYGNKSQLFTYLFPDSAFTYNFFQEPTGIKQHMNRVSLGMPNAIFYIGNYPRDFDSSKNFKLEQILLSHGYEKVEKDSFFYYMK